MPRRSGPARRMRPATRSSASSHETRRKPRSPRRRTIGCASRPSSRSSRPFERCQGFDVGERARRGSRVAVLTFSSSRRVVQRCTPLIVQSWKPATPSAHPSHTPLRQDAPRPREVAPVLPHDLGDVAVVVRLLLPHRRSASTRPTGRGAAVSDCGRDPRSRFLRRPWRCLRPRCRCVRDACTR